MILFPEDHWILESHLFLSKTDSASEIWHSPKISETNVKVSRLKLDQSLNIETETRMKCS